jgi:DNA primase
MNGTKLPESVVELSKEKESVILFVDGDRGGNLIIKNVTENAKIDYIAMAPDGKEVEELTGKEALQALRKKVPAKEYKPDNRSRGVRDYKDNKSSRYDRRDTNQSNRKAKDSKDIKKMSTKEKDEIKENVQDLVGSKGALIFNEKLETIKKLPLGRLGSLDLEEDPYIIAIDGTATPRVIENCEKLGCSNLIASNFVNADTNINLVSI